tara:strand:- start:2168 stop:2320 length:153 start_codon:yes stop_codon:yes gene_type:complete
MIFLGGFPRLTSFKPLKNNEIFFGKDKQLFCEQPLTFARGFNFPNQKSTM